MKGLKLIFINLHKKDWLDAKQEIKESAIAYETLDRALTKLKKLTLWLLAFCCRGFYWADFTSLKSVDIDEYDKYKTLFSLKILFNLFSELGINKSSLPIIQIYSPSLIFFFHFQK